MGDNIQNLSFEQALAELEQIVKTLESGNIELDKSIAQYERGEKLKQYCSQKLQEAEQRVEKINLSNGEIKGVEAAGL
ncbi:MAG: exodeoxyribonuclease VII small subunit [OCS116 cluster bacterium]|uniref:Exodeoxyribonuclease 7 small subunit n=1 Tax=OCS116 cluster bacterium TaxID=2030921 RepID=A0A2A4Z8K1_9PROT|nr:exodeoxyribonuclease VII small subunit [OCS116 cluster bacterium]